MSAEYREHIKAKKVKINSVSVESRHRVQKSKKTHGNFHHPSASLQTLVMLIRLVMLISCDMSQQEKGRTSNSV